MRFDSGGKFFSIIISNSMTSSQTKPSSDRNHGHGIHKIQEICENMMEHLNRRLKTIW
ncbi:MAG: GHKL domain-containing protein [Lachnospiraceae bacterium]|nr:GHKL domain-containing protein [Lachnospiraceae bacterium]